MVRRRLRSGMDVKSCHLNSLCVCIIDPPSRNTVVQAPVKRNGMVRRPSLLLAPGYGMPILSITFGPVVGNAEHLAVLG